MAGSYPDVPGLRMAYHRDGTIGFRSNSGFTVNPTVFSQANLQSLNDYNLGSSAHSLGTQENAGYGLIFPEPRDIHGSQLYLSTDFNPPNMGSYQWSTNTTTGIDGTWTTGPAAVNSFATVANRGDKSFRDPIQTLSFTGVKAIRFAISTGNVSTSAFVTWQVFGKPAAGEAPDRLRFWHPVHDQEVDGAFFDWGDVGQSTTLLRDFRVKNPSSTLTAQQVSLTFEALTDTTPSNVSAHNLSLDGVTFTPSVNLGDLAPGQISPTIRARRVTPSNAVVGLHLVGMVASAAGWV